MTHLLAVDGGGSHTKAGLYDADGEFIAEAQGGPANPVDTSTDNCIQVIVSLAKSLVNAQNTEVDTIVAGIAGVSDAEQAQNIAQRLMDELDAKRSIVSDDLVPLLIANVRSSEGLIVVSGTGSCVLARDTHGEVARLGGRGPVLGDRGSAYQIALSGLREAAAAVDQRGPDTSLVDAFLKTAELQVFSDFGKWTASASRDEVAELAIVVSREAENGDGVARVCLEEQALELVEDVVAALAKYELPDDSPVVFHGGVFDNSHLFTRAFVESLTKKLPAVTIEPASISGHEAAASLALTHPLPDYVVTCGADRMAEPLDEPEGEEAPSDTKIEISIPDPDELTNVDQDEEEAIPAMKIEEAEPDQPVTERHVDRAKQLDEMTASEISEAMSIEDAHAAQAVAAAAPNVAKAMDAAAEAIRTGGRIIYLGAGTSGRLGVLDASECPPTFGVPQGQVVGFIAGGDKALRTSIEGAEDDTRQASKDLGTLDPPMQGQDFVVGITASGTTPYVTAALEHAKSIGCTTALICCNDNQDSVASIVIFLDTGPEILAGSTRLKAGTATKLALNQISTGAMALSGHIYQGYMVGMQPENDKLQKRACQIVADLTGISLEAAGDLMGLAKFRIPVAVIMSKMGKGANEAAEHLQSSGGSLRDALQAE